MAAVESLSTSQKPPKLIWMAGAGTAAPIGDRLKHRFESLFGKGNVSFEDSIISWGRYDPEEYGRVAEDTACALKSGQRVFHAYHSLGGVEGMEILKIIEKNNPEILDDGTLGNLNIILLSIVGGHNNFQEAVRFMMRLRKLENSIPFGIPSVRRGIDSLAVLPGDEFDDNEFSTGMQRLFDARLNRHHPQFHAIFEKNPSSCEADLTEKEKKTLERIDEKIMTAIEREDVREVLRGLWERSRIGVGAVQNLYFGYDETGRYAAHYKEALGLFVKGLLTKSAPAYLGFMKLLPAMFTNEPRKVIKRFREYGANVAIIHSEYDPLYTAEEIANLADDLQAPVLELQLDDHQSYMARPARIAEAFRFLLSNSA